MDVDVDLERKCLAREELAPLDPVAAEQAGRRDRRLAGPHSRRPAPRSAGSTSSARPAGSARSPRGQDRRTHLAGAQQHRALAEPLHGRRVVGDEDDRPASLLELGDPGEALPLERLVADGEHLIEQENVGVEEGGDREAKAHVHPRRVRADRPVDGLLELRESDDLVEALLELPPTQPLQRAVQEDVLAPGEIRVEAGAELEQRPDPAADRDAPRVGRMIPATMRQQRRLPLSRSGRSGPPPRPAPRRGDVSQRLHVVALPAPARTSRSLSVCVSGA